MKLLNKLCLHEPYDEIVIAGLSEPACADFIGKAI
jgi:hypothetical protein